MVVGRERFTPRQDLRGVGTVVALGLATTLAAAGLIAAILLVLDLLGVGA